MGVKLSIKTNPSAKQNKIGPVFEGLSGQYFLKISLTTAPENGKANKDLIKLLAKSLKFPASDFTLVSGQTNKQKIILIKDIDHSRYPHIQQWIESYYERTNN